MNKSEYRNTWIADKLDRINLTVPKGKKAIIKTHAESKGESANGFINRAIDETMERDAITQQLEATLNPPQHEISKQQPDNKMDNFLKQRERKGLA